MPNHDDWGRRESTSAYTARVKREAEAAKRVERGEVTVIGVGGVKHVPDTAWDAMKAFRSRPASDDYLAKCSCGWVSSKHYHGSQIGNGSDEAWAGAWRHLRKVQREYMNSTTIEQRARDMDALRNEKEEER